MSNNLISKVENYFFTRNKSLLDRLHDYKIAKNNLTKLQISRVMLETLHDVNSKQYLLLIINFLKVSLENNKISRQLSNQFLITTMKLPFCSDMVW